jgi:hypothetical protein
MRRRPDRTAEGSPQRLLVALVLVVASFLGTALFVPLAFVMTAIASPEWNRHPLAVGVAWIMTLSLVAVPATGWIFLARGRTGWALLTALSGLVLPVLFWIRNP